MQNIWTPTTTYMLDQRNSIHNLLFWKTEVHGLNLRFLNVESVSRPLSP